MTKQTDSNIVSRSEFARLQGVGRARISQLATDGRLVLAPNGKDVCVIESMARIEATRDISKIETVHRHAKARDAKKSQTEIRLERELTDMRREFVSWFDYAGKLDGGVYRLLRAIESNDSEVLAMIERRDVETLERFIYSDFEPFNDDAPAQNDDDDIFAELAKPIE